MNLNIFVPLDLNKISQLKFIERTVPFMFSEAKDSPIIQGAIHTVSSDTKDKLVELFKGKDDVKINKDDKIYVFPGCKIPQFKIKEGLRELGAKFTSNYEEATIYLGSEQAFKDVQQANFSVNLLGGSYYNTFTLCVGMKKGMMLNYENGRYGDIYKNSSVFYTRTPWGLMKGNIDQFDNIEMVSAFHTLTILGGEILYRKLAKKIPVLSENGFLSQLTPTVVIDREMYLTLNDMLASRNDEDNQLALQTMSNCDIPQSRKYIYPLVKYNFDKFKDSRFKNVKLFNTMIKLKEIQKLSVRDFIVTLMKDNPDSISKDVIRQLFDNESELYAKDCKNSDLFDIVLVPKQQFQGIVPNLTYKYELDDKK